MYYYPSQIDVGVNAQSEGFPPAETQTPEEVLPTGIPGRRKPDPQLGGKYHQSAPIPSPRGRATMPATNPFHQLPSRALDTRTETDRELNCSNTTLPFLHFSLSFFPHGMGNQTQHSADTRPVLSHWSDTTGFSPGMARRRKLSNREDSSLF